MTGEVKNLRIFLVLLFTAWTLPAFANSPEFCEAVVEGKTELPSNSIFKFSNGVTFTFEELQNRLAEQILEVANLNPGDFLRISGNPAHFSNQGNLSFVDRLARAALKKGVSYVFRDPAPSPEELISRAALTQDPAKLSYVPSFLLHQCAYLANTRDPWKSIKLLPEMKIPEPSLKLDVDAARLIILKKSIADVMSGFQKRLDSGEIPEVTIDIPTAASADEMIPGSNTKSPVLKLFSIWHQLAIDRGLNQINL